MPNHELIDRGHLVGGGDLYRVGAVAEVGRDTPRRGVRLHEETKLLKFNEDPAHGRGRDAQVIAI